VINHVIRLIQTYMAPYKTASQNEEEEFKLPNDIEDKLYNALVFGIIWGIGGCLEESSRPKFDVFLQEMLNGEDVVAKYKVDLGKEYETLKIPNRIGDYKSLFDLFFDQEEMRWVNWMSTVEKYTIDKDLTYL
jgi:hypothetical protein